MAAETPVMFQGGPTVLDPNYAVSKRYEISRGDGCFCVEMGPWFHEPFYDIYDFGSYGLDIT